MNTSPDYPFETGPCQDHSLAKGRRTLFVNGVQDYATIREWAIVKDVSHIHFGSDGSFHTNGVNDAEGWASWQGMIVPFLQEKWLCTLELDLSEIEGLIEDGLCEFNNFIPLISAKVPYISLLNYNAVIKIDDRNQSNPGVWYHRVHTLMDTDKFVPNQFFIDDEAN
jgi:hypothetical protein